MPLSQDAPVWAHQLEQELNAAISRAAVPPTRLKAQLKAGIRAGQMVVVPDETGGATIAWWDPITTTPGNWRRIRDNAIVS